MSPITTHILDISLGRPAEGVAVELDRMGADGAWAPAGRGRTSADGRVGDLLKEVPPAAGRYRLRFEVGAYFERRKIASIYPVVEVVFVVDSAGGHYHIPLLLSPFGYSTYRGS